MAASWHSAAAAILALAAPAPAPAATFLTADADLRWLASGRGAPADPVVAGTGLGARHVFSGSGGDRVVLFAFPDWRDNFREFVLDQAYAQVKGPMGSWNATAGRFILPFGLLTGFGSTRLPFPGPEGRTLGFDTDNGAMLSGLEWDTDYGLAVTQGTGPVDRLTGDSPALVTGRTGWDMADGMLQVGVSGAGGRTRSAGHGTMPMAGASPGGSHLGLGAVDATYTPGPGIMRAEFAGGRRDGGEFLALWAGYDHAILPGFELNTGVAAADTPHGTEKAGAAGFTVGVAGLKFRASLIEHFGRENEHEFTLQAYYLRRLVL
jgi:hypothetical protein